MATHGITIVSRESKVLFDCSWKLLDDDTPTSRLAPSSQWQTVDIVFESNLSLEAQCHGVGDTTGDLEDAQVVLTGKDGRSGSTTSATCVTNAVFGFLSSCLKTASCSPSGCVAKFIIPLTKGQIVRSDIVPLRFIDCEVVALATSFAEPLQFYPGTTLVQDELHAIDQVLNASVAGLLLQEFQSADSSRATADFKVLSSIAEDELEERMSFTWISRQPLRRHRLAIVEGSPTHPDNGGTGPSIYLAAKALGIDMVVFDNSGHWLEKGDFDHWREAFIPTTLVHTPDPEFTDRIVAAVNSYDKPIDGIITFFDKYKVDVAYAAMALNLPTVGSPESYRIATNKYETSLFSGHDAFKASSAEEVMRVASERELSYPLIIKPCNGWSSEGVFRVDSFAELEKAAHSIDQDRHGSDFVVEKYCSGPEVDANFVLLDGEILFFESSDDSPKSADSNASYCGIKDIYPSPSRNFIELSSIFPSALPRPELNSLRSNFHDVLSRLGFRNGIMHLEGRIERSAVEYQIENDGIIDLGAKIPVNSTLTLTAEYQPPTPWLIEINPRPPGMKGTQIIESTYGIDYWGLDMLLVLSQGKERIRALAQPFKHGPQYTSVMVFIPADYSSDRQGIFDSEDVCTELFSRCPELTKNVSRFGCLVKRGQRVPHPNSGIHSFLAYFNVFSRKGRREALKLAAMVREEVRFNFK